MSTDIEVSVMATALKEISKTLNQAWHSTAAGWRELLARSGAALTRFVPRKNDMSKPNAGSTVASFPRWSMLAGEVIDRDDSIVVHIELPGIAREDCDVRVEDHTLRVRGEKHAQREHVDRSYYVMERAYGSFERVVPLPAEVDADSAKATLRDAVLRVELKKRSDAPRHLVKVN
jgi:HSP20 family protein